MSKSIPLALVGVAMATTASAQSMPRGSFLLRPAKSIDGVIAQMDKQPGIARRYTQHYGMSQSQVRRYFRSLRPTRMGETTRAVVYGYHRSGITDDPQTLKRGELVYRDSMGRFAMRAVCGNPMTNGIQARQALGEDLVARDSRPASAAPSAPEEAMVAEPAPVVTNTETVAVAENTSVQPIEATSTPVVNPTVDPVVVNTPAPAPAVEVIPQTSPTVPAVSSGGNNNLLPILLGVGAVTGIALAASNDGNAAPVPEPASMLIMGTGLAALARRRKKG